jgi:hypothetical protein
MSTSATLDLIHSLFAALDETQAALARSHGARERAMADVLAERLTDLREALYRVEGRATRYTTAPVVYDGFGTVTEDTAWLDTRGQRWRKVRIHPAQYSWQTARYASGMHPALEFSEFERLQEIHRIVPAPAEGV